MRVLIVAHYNVYLLVCALHELKKFVYESLWPHQSYLQDLVTKIKRIFKISNDPTNKIIDIDPDIDAVLHYK